MKYFILISILLAGTIAGAQQKVFVVNPGQRIGDVFTRQDIYAYPVFGQGTVYFNDGSNSNALMNYNSLYGEIQFIDPKGDTLSLADESRIKMLTINNDSFYFDHDHGYLQQLSKAGNLRLMRRVIIRQTSSAKIGLYNQSVEGGAASSYTVLSSGAHDANLMVNEKVTFSKEENYFFTDEKGRVQPVSRKSAEKISGKKDAVAAYFASHNVDFKSEADLEGLVSYLQTH